MKISLDAIKVLQAIEEWGTFARAAKALHRVPSALTYTVNNLESQLNIKIFDRKGYRATFTPIGRMLVEEGKKLLLDAGQLENKIKLKQTGWEDKLCIAYDQVIPFENLLFLIEAFYQQHPHVELKLSGEILGGCWDALYSQRASLAIGVTGEPPFQDDIAILPFGEVEFVFLVGKNHPLAKQQKPLTNQEIKKHRIIAIADSARLLKPRTSGILVEQSVLTVTTFQEKIKAMVRGLGVGYLPYAQAKPYIDSGDLILKKGEKTKSKGSFSVAWRPPFIGKAASWFIEKLYDKKIQQKILSCP